MVKRRRCQQHETNHHFPNTSDRYYTLLHDAHLWDVVKAFRGPQITKVNLKHHSSWQFLENIQWNADGNLITYTIVKPRYYWQYPTSQFVCQVNNSHRKKRVLHTQKTHIQGTVFDSTNSNKLLLAKNDLYVVNIHSNRKTRIIPNAFSKFPRRVRLHYDHFQRHILYSHHDCTTQCWDINTGQLLRTFECANACDPSAAYLNFVPSPSSSSQLYVFNKNLFGIQLLDLNMRGNKYRTLRSWLGHTHNITGLSFNHTYPHHYFATSSYDSTVRIWDVRRENQSVRAIRFDVDPIDATPLYDLTDNYLMVGLDHTINVYDAQTFELHKTHEMSSAKRNSDYAIMSMELHPKTRLLSVFYGPALNILESDMLCCAQ